MTNSLIYLDVGGQIFKTSYQIKYLISLMQVSPILWAGLVAIGIHWFWLR